MGSFKSKPKNEETLDIEGFKKPIRIEGELEDIERIKFILSDYEELVKKINKVEMRMYLERLGLKN